MPRYTKQRIIKRTNRILYVEGFIVAIIAAVSIVRYFDLHAAIGLVIFFVTFPIFYFLFFRVRLFRYIFSIAVSLVGAFFAGALGRSIDHQSFTTAYVFAGLALVFLLLAHKDHFRFVRDSDIVENEHSEQ